VDKQNFPELILVNSWMSKIFANGDILQDKLSRVTIFCSLKYLNICK